MERMAGLARGKLGVLASFSILSKVAKETKPTIFERQVSYRKSCKFMDKPRCNLETIKKSDYYKDFVEGRVLPDHPLGKIWDKPGCCDQPCKDAFSRFDDLYYFISDKSKRKYTRTWNECPKMIRCKRICCFDGKERSPPFKKRPKNYVIDTACPSTPDCMALTGNACPKIRLPGCRSVRKGNLQCKHFIRAPCQKFCTPYPSFSECLRDRPEPTKMEECACLEPPMHCELVGLDNPYRLPRCNKP